MPKVVTKTLGKSVKYVQRRIIQTKISGGNFMLGKFSEGVIVQRRTI